MEYSSARPAQSTFVTCDKIARVLFQVLAFVIASTTPRSPQLGVIVLSSTLPEISVDSTAPSEATPLLAVPTSNVGLAQPTTVYPVTQISSCSPLSYVLFAWVTPVLARGSHLASLTKSDLPALPRRDRSANLWSEMQATQVKPPSWFNALLWRLVVVNKNLFIWQSVLAIITACLYYLPAFFLQRIVFFLETSSSRSDASMIMGYAYCVGLFLACILDAVFSGQASRGSGLGEAISAHTDSLLAPLALVRQ